MSPKHTLTSVYTETHKCKLDKLQFGRELPSHPPYASAYIKHFYGFAKTWMTVSDVHPLCKSYFRSEFAIFKEKRRQLQNINYRIIIHPFSGFAILLKTAGIALWSIIFFMDPFIKAFAASFIDPDADTYLQDTFLICLNVLLALHSASNFFMGFEIDKTKEIVLDHKRIVRRYLMTYFAFDFLPIVYQVVYQCSGRHHRTVSTLPLFALRFVRLPTMLDHLLTISSFYKIPKNASKCIVLLLFQLTLIHWWACMFFLISAITYYYHFPSRDSWVIASAVGTDRSFVSLYLETVMSIACHYLGAGKGNFKTHNPTEQCLLAVLMMCGVTVQIYIVALILLIFGTINISESKYEEMMVQLNDYMQAKRLSPELKQRLHVYYRHRFQKQFFYEDIILSALSEHLRYEVLLYSCKNLIQRMRLLRGASKEVIGAIVSMLRQEIFLPNDTILKANVYDDLVYFVSSGTVAIYSEFVGEAAHVEDGQHFGELAMVLTQKNPFPATAVALEVTEVFYLEKKDFAYIASLDPDLAARIQQNARDKMITYETALAEARQKFDRLDILAELRRGRILDKRRKRH